MVAVVGAVELGSGFMSMGSNGGRSDRQGLARCSIRTSLQRRKCSTPLHELGTAVRVDKPHPDVYRFLLADGSVRLLVWSDRCAGTIDLADLIGDRALVRPVVPDSGALPPAEIVEARAVVVDHTPRLVEASP